jgi:uncharacterized paraquat-inducible protein A
MALINCPDCKKQISDEAKRCMNCGYPVRVKQKYLGVRVLMSIVIMAIGLYLVLNGSAMPGGIAILFGLFMVLFGGLVFISILWKIITG